MSLKAMTEEEQEIVRKTIEATFDYFSWDYHTRIGVEPERVRELLSAWPSIDDSDDGSDACIAISNSLNDLLHGEGITDQIAVDMIGCNRDELRRIYSKWAIARGWEVTGVR